MNFSNYITSAVRSFYRTMQTPCCLEKILERFLNTNATKESLLILLYFLWIQKCFGSPKSFLCLLIMLCAKIGSTHRTHRGHGLSTISYNLTCTYSMSILRHWSSRLQDSFIHHATEGRQYTNDQTFVLR